MESTISALNERQQQKQFLDKCSPIFIEYQLMREL
jgi:hypothetical protein